MLKEVCPLALTEWNRICTNNNWFQSDLLPNIYCVKSNVNHPINIRQYLHIYITNPLVYRVEFTLTLEISSRIPFHSHYEHSENLHRDVTRLISYRHIQSNNFHRFSRKNPLKHTLNFQLWFVKLKIAFSLVGSICREHKQLSDRIRVTCR